MALPIFAAFRLNSVVASSGAGSPFFLIEHAVWFVCATASSILASSLILALLRRPTSPHLHGIKYS